MRIIARLNVGGPAIHVLNLSAGMTGRFSTTLLAGKVDSTEVDLSEQWLPGSVDLRTLPELGRNISIWRDLVTFIRLYRCIRQLRPDIVHTHTAKAGTLGRLAALLARVPIRVHTFHGHVMSGYFSPLRTRLVITAERLLARVTTCLVTVSDRQADELVHSLRVCAPDRMRVIPLGFDLEPFARERLARLRGQFRDEIRAGTAPIISAVGRLVPIKNHDLLLNALARIDHLNQPFTLAIVGGGPEEDRLRARVSELGLDERVRFLGWRKDLDRIYADTDVVALTSINEGTPVCLIEALAAGCAVVATDVGGVADVLENGRLGSVVSPNDPVELSEALRAALHDGDRREELAAERSQSARNRFGLERLLEDISGLYDELLASNGVIEPSSSHSNPTPV